MLDYIETAKFFLFDVGVVRTLSGMRLIQEGSEEFGRAFEHFLIEEIRAFLGYREKFLPLAYWRTSTGLEVDLIVGDMDLAIEIKSSRQVDERHIADQTIKETVIVDRRFALR